MKKKEITDSGKRVYEVKDIQQIVGLGKQTAYRFIQEAYEKQEPFRVFKIGGTYRIPVDSFESWMNGDSLK